MSRIKAPHLNEIQFVSTNGQVLTLSRTSPALYVSADQGS